jgi:hypothetical protein
MSIKIGGCAAFKIIKKYEYDFAEGSVVYFIPKAKKGILEPHAIKEAMMKFINGNDMSPIFLYKDSFNAYFNGNELCSQADAIAYAKAFYEGQIATLETR